MASRSALVLVPLGLGLLVLALLRSTDDGPGNATAAAPGDAGARELLAAPAALARDVPEGPRTRQGAAPGDVQSASATSVLPGGPARLRVTIANVAGLPPGEPLQLILLAAPDLLEARRLSVPADGVLRIDDLPADLELSLALERGGRRTPPSPPFRTVQEGSTLVDVSLPIVFLSEDALGNAPPAIAVHQERE